MKLNTITLLLLLFLYSPVESQDFGAYPSGIPWKQINTRSVRVIFPEELEAQAQRVANLVSYLDQNNRATIGTLHKKLDLILNNQGIIPNGYVTLGPYRSEFFTTPFQQSSSLGSLPWLDLLSIHEYRHALQYINFRRGITRIGYFLGGETVWALAANLAVPNWYFEGDAVVTETALTPQGRGRIPSFNQGFKSSLGNEKMYTYEQVRNNSYRLDIPDHYRLGYLLCSYGREHYGDDLWLRVMNETAHFKGIIYPFSKALERNTGLNSRQFYKEAFAYYQEKWQSESPGLEPGPAKTLNRKFRTVTHYEYPVFDAKLNEWLAVKSSFKKTAAIIRLNEKGKETPVVSLGMHLDPYFSAGSDFLAWCEISWDYRFSALNYSDIVVFDRSTQKKRYLTTQGRYFSPALSPDQARILVLHSGSDMKHELQILDRETGEILKKLPNAENLYFTYPQWSLDGKWIFTTARNSEGKMSILQIDAQSGSSQTLVEALNHIFGRLSVGKDRLYFSSSLEGTEDITVLDLNTRKLSRIRATNYGASNPSVNASGSLLCYSAFYHTGTELEILSLDAVRPSPVRLTNLDELMLNQFGFSESEGGVVLNELTEEIYPVKNYNPLLRSLKFHSWSPTAEVGKLGLNLVSDNVLNNFHLEAGYQYFLNEASHGFGVSALYGQYLPLISLSYSQGFRNPGAAIADNLKVWESRVGLGAEIPLDFSKGLFNRTVTGGIEIQSTSTPSIPGLINLNSRKIRFGTVGIHSKFLLSRISARQNISTPLGIGGELLFNRSFTNLRASQLQLYLDGSIRGILPNQNLVLGFSFKKESAWNPYQYLDLNAYPRGYQPAANNWLATWQFNYHFPLFYPDLGAGGIIYLSRVRANAFVDYGFGSIIHPVTGAPVSYTFPSFGGELIFDLNLLNLVPASVGMRLTALGQTDLYNPGRSSFFEVFFPILRL